MGRGHNRIKEMFWAELILALKEPQLQQNRKQCKIQYSVGLFHRPVLVSSTPWSVSSCCCCGGLWARAACARRASSARCQHIVWVVLPLLSFSQLWAPPEAHASGSAWCHGPPGSCFPPQRRWCHPGCWACCGHSWQSVVGRPQIFFFFIVIQALCHRGSYIADCGSILDPSLFAQFYSFYSLK